MAQDAAPSFSDLVLDDQARADLDEFLAYAREFYLRCRSIAFCRGTLELTRQDGDDLMWEDTVHRKQKRKHAKPSRRL